MTTTPDATKDNFYVTTPIYYVNAKPHIGTAYTSFVADTLSRYMRLDGREVYFMTGTDEHGQKVAESANAAGITPQAFCDQMSKHFSDMGDAFGFTNDVFSRTTSPSHKEGAIAFWNKLVENGYIYKGSYAGWYAVRDECFYGEDELVDGKAPTGADVAWVEEPSYFFKLSAFQDKLLKFYEENPHCVLPKGRLNEVKRFVEGGLRDLSVSRSSFKWGIPVPGDPDHVMYVWVEALPVYLTSIGYPNTEDPHFQKNWAQSLHLVGKDILRFHAVYWPALLMAAGLTPPKTVFAHGWWTNGGQKISKSLGNVIDPFELVEQFGQDAVRFFLMREVPLGQDGDFSHKALIQRTNSDLANAYGNLVQRVLSFIYKNADATLAGLDNLLPADQELLAHAQNLYGAIQKDMETYQVHKVLESIWQVIIAANKYVDEQAPWSLRKTDTERMNQVLAVLVDVIRRVTIFTQPFVPQAANQILDTLNINHGNRSFKALDITLPKGHQINEPKGAFPRIAEEA